jgi:hypothetical protein
MTEGRDSNSQKAQASVKLDVFKGHSSPYHNPKF